MKDDNKERIKLIITSISIFYMVVISILTISTLNNITSYVDLDTKDFTKEFDKVRVKVNTIENIDCRNSVINIINKSEKLSNNNTISLKELYNNGLSILDYGDIMKKCNIKDKDRETITAYMMNSALTYEEYIQKGIFEYEINIKDKENRWIMEASIMHARLDSNKVLELELLNKIIEVQNEK
ncbi:MAG: hypothetical protein VZS44_03930 [Bacilli bacterium]|nr:hypothetical protein [Bacilli bacterium]